MSTIQPSVHEMRPNDAHNEHMAHHFDTPAQQFDASKFGMWLFLATEILLFAGLFCVYAVYRRLHPEIFAYGAQFLDVRMGALNTIVLLVSSYTMAMAVWAAQRGRRRQLLVFLQLTFLGGALFMGIKYIEYSEKLEEGLVWGESFYKQPDWVVAQSRLEQAQAALVRESQSTSGAGTPPGRAATGTALVPGDPEVGRGLWMGTCRSCHGPAGHGVPDQGKAIAGVEFVTSRSDQQLLEFLKVGRRASDPANTMNKEMPIKGGNPLRSDQDLMHVIAFLRTLASPADGTMAGAATQPAGEQQLWLERSTIPPAPAGPKGLAPRLPASAREIDAHAKHPHHTVDQQRPQNAHLFFGFYFCLTGLHGLHVLAGMAVITWLITRASRGHFDSSYYTPVDLGGLYWHLVDLIWIFLFPLLYLIH